jgi:hypothetical protein
VLTDLGAILSAFAKHFGFDRIEKLKAGLRRIPQVAGWRIPTEALA